MALTPIFAGRPGRRVIMYIVMVKRAKRLIVCLFLCRAGLLSAADDGGLPGSFLTLPAGARGAAIGAPYSSWPGDSSSVFWNPAQLSAASKPELFFSRTQLFEDTSSAAMAFSWPHKRSFAAAAGYIRQASGGYEGRTNPFDSPAPFGIVNQAFFASLSARVPKVPLDLRAGLSLKTARYSVAGVSDWGAGADAGLLAGLPHGLRAAAVVRNLAGPSLELVSETIRFPQAVELSVSREFTLGGGFSAGLGAGTVKYERRTARPSAGAELSYGRSAALRLGVSGDGLSSGVGLRLGDYSFDYAALMHEVAPLHTLSVAVRFGITSEELEEYITRGISRYDKDEAARLAEVYVKQAELLRRDGAMARAIRTLEMASLWDPANSAIEGRIVAYRAEMDAAITRQAVERNLAMADRYVENQDLLAAREYLSSALDLSPGDAAISARIAGIDKKLDERERRSLEESRRREAAAKAAALLKKASGHLGDEDYAKAITAAEKAAALNPEDAAGANSLLRIARQGLNLAVAKRLREIDKLCQSGDYAGAMKLRAAVLKDDPGNREADLKGRLCKPENARKPGSEEQKRIEKLYYMAVDAYLKNDLRTAAVHIREILSLDQDNEAARKLEGKILWAEGGDGK